MRCIIQFRKLGTDPAKSLERKVQRTLRKIKHKFEENKYKKLYQQVRDRDCFMENLKYIN